MSRSYRVAVIGARGGVGRELISILEERGFPVRELSPLAESIQLGDSVEFQGKTIPLERVCPPALSGVEIAFFCTPPGVAANFAPEVTRRRGLVIDLSSGLRADPTVPLVVPEVNPSLLEQAFLGAKRYTVTSPGAISVAVAVALRPLQEKFGIARVIASTYQATSGAGKRALDELHEQTASLLNARDFEHKAFPAQIAFNVQPEVPAGGGFGTDGSSAEEREISQELRRLLGLPSLDVAVTAAFVPTFVGHAAAVLVETKETFDLPEVKDLLRVSPGILLTDELPETRYPMNTSIAGEDAVLVGRVRRAGARALWLWLGIDNLRKGAALNAVQIAELVARDHANAIGPQP